MQRIGGTNESRWPHKSASGVCSSCEENGKPQRGF